MVIRHEFVGEVVSDEGDVICGRCGPE